MPESYFILPARVIFLVVNNINFYFGFNYYLRSHSYLLKRKHIMEAFHNSWKENEFFKIFELQQYFHTSSLMEFNQLIHFLKFL